MEKIKCIAIDDEAPALRVVEQYVNQMPLLTLAATFRNPFEAREWLKLNTCDILFLDIQMSQQNGIDFFKSLVTKPIVIFTTAYSEFAADAFDLDAADYLRKPFSYERFAKAIEKAKDYLQLPSQSVSELQLHDAENFISVKSNGRLTKIFFSEILYIEAFQEYIKIFTEKERHITYERMKNIEAILPAEKFMRVHRSYIVALSQVKSISGNMLEVAGQQIPVSREMKEKLVKKVF
jgi:DNA-binding LytR/AlgR family response regulator